MNNEPTLFDQPMSSLPSVSIPVANRNDNYYEKIMPTLNNRQEQVLNAIAEIDRSCTMHEVADFLKIPLNAISGRFGELVKKEKIKVVGKTQDRKSIYKVI